MLLYANTVLDYIVSCEYISFNIVLCKLFHELSHKLKSINFEIRYLK